MFRNFITENEISVPITTWLVPHCAKYVLAFPRQFPFLLTCSTAQVRGSQCSLEVKPAEPAVQL